MWNCRCDCKDETLVVVTTQSLIEGKTQSCGCLQRERASISAIEKGEEKSKYPHEYKTRLYRIWKAMKDRTCNENSQNYQRYGKRGITICEEWKNDYYSFKEWALKNGYSDDLSIDRIDNDSSYFPENCRWSTRKEQANNTRRNVVIEYNNKSMTISEWSDELNIDSTILWKRLHRGWSIEKTLITPVKQIKKENI